MTVIILCYCSFIPHFHQYVNRVAVNIISRANCCPLLSIIMTEFAYLIGAKLLKQLPGRERIILFQFN